MCAFFMVHSNTPSWRLCGICAISVIGAALTKGIEGVIPGVGVGLYLVLNCRMKRLFLSPRYWVALACIAAFVLAYYLEREILTPGYLNAVLSNELSGRFNSVIGRHVGSGLF